MTTEEAICQLVRDGILHHEPTLEEKDLNIATFYLVTSVTPELTAAMNDHRVAMEGLMSNITEDIFGGPGSGV